MANESLSVIECTTVDDELLAAMQRLVPQLSSSSPPPDRTRLAEIVESPACHLLLARDGSAVLGSMTLVVFPIPTGIRAWIEDVVVDSDARGRGVGEALNRRAIEIALERGLEPWTSPRDPNERLRTASTSGWGSSSATPTCTGWSQKPRRATEQAAAPGQRSRVIP
ncbi:MAG: GNAT family N-acetyltransferase [Microthrixaceae bacterium]